MRKLRVKRKTSLGKICSQAATSRLVGGRLKPTELSASGMAQDTGGVTLAPSSSDSQQRSVVYTRSNARVMFVPVVDSGQTPLMPTTVSRARKSIKSGKATPFWKRGVFCIRFNIEPSAREYSQIALGVDPGSKREAFTIKSRFHTYLNVLTETPHWVKDAVEGRRNARRVRRYRNVSCRKNKKNRARGGLPPSTKARWQWKERIANWILRMYPITDIVIEDIKAQTKGKRKWDVSFSPLEVGKQWFYDRIGALCRLTIKQGHETAALRKKHSLKKNKSKLADAFDCHNVDSWVLANAVVGGHRKPDNINLIKLVPLQFHRRQLHVFQPAKGNIRKPYGGTRSVGFTRGSIVKYKKHGVCYIGGTMGGKVSLHESFTGKRATQSAKVSDIKFFSYASWRMEEKTGR